jgi:hypothetical protein
MQQQALNLKNDAKPMAAQTKEWLMLLLFPINSNFSFILFLLCRVSSHGIAIYTGATAAAAAAAAVLIADECHLCSLSTLHCMTGSSLRAVNSS